MRNISRRDAIAAFLAAGLWSAEAFAQGRDLTVEAAPHRPSHRPHRPVRPYPARPVQASLVPVGPSTLPVGQPLNFRMTSLSDGYGDLYVLSASGRAQVWLENVRVRAGFPFTYPHPGLIVRAAAPAGDDVVLFVATRRPIGGFVNGASSSQPFDLQLSHEDFRAALLNQLTAMPRSDWAIAVVTVRVTD